MTETFKNKYPKYPDVTIPFEVVQKLLTAVDYFGMKDKCEVAYNEAADILAKAAKDNLID